MKASCKNCNFFREENEYGGECYLNPPAIFQRNTGGPEDYISIRPWVAPNDFCGYWMTEEAEPIEVGDYSNAQGSEEEVGFLSKTL